MVPDLLVMGQRREKLAYLARLLVSPRVAAGLLRVEWSVVVHYLLRPLKLAYHYGRETVHTVQRKRAMRRALHSA